MPILSDVTESGCVTFEDLYERYHQVMARRAKCFLVRDPDLIEEVLQEAWLADWKALSRAPEPGYAWLYRIVTNTAINALRKKYHYWPWRGSKPVPLPLSLDTCYSEEGELTLGELTEDKQHGDPAQSERLAIEGALAHLSEEERQLLYYKASGRHLHEIMERRGTSYHVTWRQVEKARAAFRQAYQEQEAA